MKDYYMLPKIAKKRVCEIEKLKQEIIKFCL